MGLRITTVPADPALLDLPWELPLETWPEARVVPLPRGISRHVVRFVRVDRTIYAVKEATGDVLEREFRLLRALERDNEPAVRPVGIVTGRRDADGKDLDPALVTRHLDFSLPYRVLFSGRLQPDTAERLLDALVVLLVRLHLAAFFWGDCSLSNVLFRRDAGAFAAYLVDAETGELHPAGLSDGQRAHDLMLAETNIGGELLDLAAGGMLDEAVDPAATAAEVVRRYERLWAELLAPERMAADDRHRMESRLRRLAELGFDVEEVQLLTGPGGSWIEFRPKVVEPGHHRRHLFQLTGLDVQENQARRLLADMASFRTAHGLMDEPDDVVAHRWMIDVFYPTVARIPQHLRHKIEPAQLFHEALEHRWYLAEAAGHDIEIIAAVDSYIANILAFRPDEDALLADDSSEG